MGKEASSMPHNAPPGPTGRRLNLLVLYDVGALHVNTVRDHLEAFARCSRHRVHYAPATNGAPLRVPLELFDAVIVHYSVRLAYDWHISPAFAQALEQYAGFKALFIQDEYEFTWTASDWINGLGIDLVFTCVPPEHVDFAYGRVDRSRTEFLPTLTGYVPERLEQVRDVPPMRDRPTVVGYRARALPYRFGVLAREKFLIGVRMKEICAAAGVPHDIEWAEDKRLYGAAWDDFLLGCKTTLGTESGSNVFDFDGSLTARVDAALRDDPAAPFEAIYDRLIAPHDRHGVMNQVSPRVFEAVALRTALILFEGRYSGVVEPWEHYLPLKKDFSNVDEILRLARDDDYLEALVDRAYRHIVGSGRRGYRAFVAGVDAAVEQRVPAKWARAGRTAEACLVKPADAVIFPMPVAPPPVVVPEPIVVPPPPPEPVVVAPPEPVIEPAVVEGPTVAGRVIDLLPASARAVLRTVYRPVRALIRRGPRADDPAEEGQTDVARRSA
jgi:hypothetical protein